MTLEICKIEALDREFNFVLNNAVDHIQNVIRSGTFYELEELELIAELVDCPKRILDVGANLGNHSLYFAHRFDPDLTIPVEPNPGVVPLLLANLGLNFTQDKLRIPTSGEHLHSLASPLDVPERLGRSSRTHFWEWSP